MHDLTTSSDEVLRFEEVDSNAPNPRSLLPMSEVNLSLSQGLDVRSPAWCIGTVSQAAHAVPGARALVMW